MPNFQSAVNRITNTIMGASVALPYAGAKYTDNQIAKASNYAKNIKPLDLRTYQQADAHFANMTKYGKYVPQAYKQQFNDAMKNIRPVSLREKIQNARAEQQAEWQAEQEATMLNSIQNRQNGINKSKGTKILPRDKLFEMQAEYAMQMMKEDDTDGE